MRIAIIYGGKSVEHTISIRSVRNVLNHIETLGLQPVLIGIDQSGKAYLQESYNVKINPDIILPDKPVYFSPGDGMINSNGNLKIDCAIPLIHGTYGEDGCLQGVLEICQIPYTGENVATSAICMDKHLRFQDPYI